MDMTPYPVERPPTGTSPGGRRARGLAVTLLIIQGVLLALSMPVLFFLFLSLGWEGGDQALEHRMVQGVPLLGLLAVVVTALSFAAAHAVARDAGEVRSLGAVVAGLVLVLAVGWLVTLRGAAADAVLGPLWLMMTSPAPVAWLLILRLPSPRQAVHSR